MKRAARHKTGSVVFDKRRKTWNFLWWEDGKTALQADWHAERVPNQGCRSAKRSVFPADVSGNLSESPKLVESETPTVRALAARYERERLPSRHSTARMYRSWLRNHILPKMGRGAALRRSTATTGRTCGCELQAVSQRARPMCEACCVCSWNLPCGVGHWRFRGIQLTLVVVKGATKRTQSAAQFDGGGVPKVRSAS